MKPAEREAKAIIDGITFLETEINQRWGFNQLRLLVSDDLRLRFDNQLARYEEAVKANHLPSIRIQGASLRKGYEHLESNAKSAGLRPITREAWSCLNKATKTPVSVVRLPEHTTEAWVDHGVVFSIDELVKMIANPLYRTGYFSFIKSTLIQFNKVIIFTQNR